MAATKRADVAMTEQPAAGEGPNNERRPKSANDGGQIVAVPDSLDSGGGIRAASDNGQNSGN